MGVDEEKLPSSFKFCMACAIGADLRGNRYAAKLYNKVFDDLKSLYDLREAVKLMFIADGDGSVSMEAYLKARAEVDRLIAESAADCEGDG